MAPPRPRLLAPLIAAACLVTAARGQDGALASFNRVAEPILEDHCYNCHGDGSKRGGVDLDNFRTDADVRNHVLWLRVMKNVRVGIMPPATEPRVPPDEEKALMTWIKLQAFSLDPAHPDPGRVTLRRLNRVEYRNTVRDLTGVDFDTEKEFPADDTGQGFDNIADVLTVSPILLERYLDTAQTVIGEAVPTQPRVEAALVINGRDFKAAAAAAPAPAPASPFARPAPKPEGHSLDLSYYTPAAVSAAFHADHAGKYEVDVKMTAVERYVDDQFDLNRCRLAFRIDGKTVVSQEFVRESDKDFDFSFSRDWKPGDHVLSFEVTPIGPDKAQLRNLRIRLGSVTVHGPEAPEYWVEPAGYAKFFPRKVPYFGFSRRKYAAEILGAFATRAFRRPVDAGTLKRLVDMAASVSSQPGGTFEAGVAQAMVAVLASPRFVFREEQTEPLDKGEVYPRVDEYSLASRLSYFLWSTMPDEELFRLAGAGQLRARLPEELTRMLADPKASEFVRNFTGQWLEARDVATVQINSLAVYLREHPSIEAENAMATFQRVNNISEEKRTARDKDDFKKARAAFVALFRMPKAQLTDPLRDAMRRETEMDFNYVIKEDRSLLELIDSDYTFLNEDLAKLYGVHGVTGSRMRRVVLPPDSPRGGILTQGTVLTVTSNPTRTSPVKRGVFILDAILGSRPPPPPPNLPALEDAAPPEKLRLMSLRENLKLHASNKTCAACHSRMDPLGLALENFNAMGAWRDREMNKPIDAGGRLITGESFTNIRELKHILATKHKRDFYYCFTEKLMTYALGRTMEYTDVDTIDRLVDELDASGGRPSVLLRGIVDSAAFQERRPAPREEMASNVAAPSTGTTN